VTCLQLKLTRTACAVNEGCYVDLRDEQVADPQRSRARDTSAEQLPVMHGCSDSAARIIPDASSTTKYKGSTKEEPVRDGLMSNLFLNTSSRLCSLPNTFKVTQNIQCGYCNKLAFSTEICLDSYGRSTQLSAWLTFCVTFFTPAY